MYHAAVAQGSTVHVPDKANAKKRKRQPGRRKPHRWIVEVAHSWINRFRRLLYYLLAQVRSSEIGSKEV